MSVCRNCKKAMSANKIVSFKDGTGWCSNDCFRKEATEATRKEEERRKSNRVM